MTTLNLNAQAAALLKRVQINNDAPLDAKVQDALAQISAPDKALTAKQVETVLLAAMPKQKGMIHDCCKFVANYHCDNTNSSFLTQILSTRIVKEELVAFRPPRPIAPRRVDPYFTDLQMDPKADFVLLFNARDVDAKGQPLLMKIVAREQADLSQINLGDYRTAEGRDSIDTFDIVKVKNNADFVQLKDADEMEFEFGDPLLAVSLNKAAEEISAAVKVAPENIHETKVYYAIGGRVDVNRPITNRNTTVTGNKLDRTPVATFSDRIRLPMAVKDTAPAGFWLDTPGMGAHTDIKLKIDRGYLFEPGGEANVTFHGSVHNLAIDKDDAQLLGNPAVGTDVAANANNSLRQILTSTVHESSTGAATGNSDNTAKNTPASQIIFANYKKVQVAGAELAPLGDKALAADGFAAAKVKVFKQPRAGDSEHDGQTVKLELDKGFLAGLDSETIKGWKVVVGFTDADGSWKEQEHKVTHLRESEKMAFSFDLDDAPALHRNNANLEVRVFNNDGVPAERVLIPLRQVSWGS